MSIYATPLGGKHRIDNFNGSVAVSNHVFIDGIDGNNMDLKQKESILKTQEKMIQTQLNILNSFIFKNASINFSLEEYKNTLSLEEYKNMLLT